MWFEDLAKSPEAEAYRQRARQRQQRLDETGDVEAFMAEMEEEAQALRERRGDLE
jgi:hypothetical protein